MTSLAGLVIAVSMAAGQAEKHGPHYEQLRVYESKIGTWVCEEKLKEDWPDVAPKGTKMVVDLCYEWELNRNAVELEWKIKLEDHGEVEGVELIRWDPAKKQIVATVINTLGETGTNTITYDTKAKVWTVKVRQLNADGKKMTSTIVHTFKDPTTFVWQAKKRRGGPVTGDSPTYTFRKRKSEEEDDDDDDD